ncbi:Hint domain-containing protein [Streptomyces sp. A2-16]|uniref:polymorphic toxin-type HINT domain-containing protein n=1 Tax=Streptomyces sp. A2-16 TaxID=2781734 RepID=UPI001BAE894B|nr:polymorphic toxin-type HINT domain-containing protein [Streptomyces sp. A2-16]QUC56725.1 Hint domain-containing protein [Streptomyces sp. A2-16]
MRTNARRRGLLPRSRFLPLTAMAVAGAIAVTGGQLPDLTGQSERTASTVDPVPTAFDAKAAERVRQEQCLLSGVLRKGGSAMKETARAGLVGTEDQLHTAADPSYWNDTALSKAYDRDKATADAKSEELSGRPKAWETSLAVQTPPPPYTYTGFQWVEAKDDPFDKIGLTSWVAAQFWKDEGDFYTNPHPLASKESVDAATAVYNSRYGNDPDADYKDEQAWESLQFMHGMYADDARLFLQYGGFPTTVPDPDSMEFRIDVENLKARFASCAYTDPEDPHEVLGAEIATAHTEWEAELDGQKTQRDAIIRAEKQANADLSTASQALGEALAQSLIANRLTDWQAYWTGQKEADHPNDYPTTAEFTKVKKWITDAQGRAGGRLYVASRAALSAKTQADAVTQAQTQAYGIADAAGLPRGRGLLYGQQAAQVAKASAAATQAAAKAVETAFNATRASAADSKTLDSLANTQAHAAKAEFRRIAAQEAEAQAKAAAEGAAAQAEEAAKHASEAKAAENKAKAAEQTAKNAAADAKAKRQKAEAERDYAKSQADLAAAERNKAHEAEGRAQSQRQVAADRLSDAQAAGATASGKRDAAVAAESRARNARNGALAAEDRRDTLVAKAEAAEALLAAVDGTADAIEARQAATKARSAADDATAAATEARQAANEATAAATNAREAATRAQGAAKRAQAAADGAQRDVAITGAAVKKAHAAAADAIAASQAAKWNAIAAKAEAETAQKAAAKARGDAVVARSEAVLANADAVRTAGYAYATGQAAAAARDSAAQVVKPANDAIELGSPYAETDSSAGLAVLTGQAAKTAAQQQVAVANAKAAQAKKAAAEAKALAARANADAKAAAEAAANAAEWAAQASTSAAAAQASSDAAAASAKAAQRSEANTVAYDKQAVADAAAAQTAATAADGYATDADASADAAERDAASARSAADAAESDASTARSVADKAERDATEAEAAAANARNLAVEAAEAAIRTQQVDFEDRKEQERTADGGGTGVEGVVMKPSGDSKVDINPLSDCVGSHSGSDIGCEIDLEFHIYGEMDFYIESCPLPGVDRAHCGSSIQRDYLTSSPLDVTFKEEDVHVDGLKLTASVLKAIATGAVADIVGCYKRKISSCAWLFGSIIIPGLLVKAAEAAFAVRTAMRGGAGLGRAIWGLRGSGLSASAAARLESLGRQALNSMCFPAGTRIATDHGTRPIEEIRAGDRVWAQDPETGERRLRTVAGVMQRTADALVSVDIGSETLRATTEHPFWVTGKGWTGAQALRPGDRLTTLDGKGARVESVSTKRAPVQVFNFEVEGDHTYFVGASRVLVHNACRIWPNNMAITLEQELAAAERLGIRPAKPGSANWDKYIDMDGEKIKWAVLQDGQLVIMPKMVGREELSHPVLSGGAPVQAAGEAQLAGGGGQYFGLEINAHSGHFFKSGDPFWAAGGGAEQLGREMFEAAGVMFG